MRAAKLESSMISRVAYDDEAEALSIWFRETGRYVYYGVPGQFTTRSKKSRQPAATSTSASSGATAAASIRTVAASARPAEQRRAPAGVCTCVAVFFTSDTHFGDHRTLNIHKRPFGSVPEMDEALIAR